MTSIARVVFRARNAARSAHTFCEHLKEADAAGEVYLFQLSGLLTEIAKLQPEAFLDAFFDVDVETELRRNRLFSFGLERSENPLAVISDEVILKWCTKKNPALRIQLIASNAPMFHRPGGKDASLEWKPLFRALVDKAPDRIDVLNHIADNVRPRSWSGSLHAILEESAALFEALQNDDDPVMREWAQDRLAWIKEWSESERRREEAERRDRDESFE